MPELPIWRTLLFIPANNWKMLNKAASEWQDGVIIDLEDACPVEDLETGRVFARDVTPTLKAGGSDVFVRVNPLDSKLTVHDLSVVVNDHIDGIMLPKTEMPENVITLEKMIEEQKIAKGINKRIAIIPIIESPLGVINAYEISNASRCVSALAFGAGDFMRELGEGFTIAKMTPDEYFSVLLYARSKVATAACAAEMPAIDTPFFGLLIDSKGLERETVKAKLLGFKGKMVIHPRHIQTVNNVFTPSEQDIAFGTKLVEAYNIAKTQGKGAATLDGKMIDVAMYKMATDLLAKAKSIEAKAHLRREKAQKIMWVPGLC